MELRARATSDITVVDIVLTKGTGRFQSVSGHATGFMECAAKELGVQTYKLKLQGYLFGEKTTGTLR